MTIQEAENVKQQLERVLNENTIDGLKDTEIFIAPSDEHDFEAFRKMWRNSTYVVALATYGHADMNVFVCDSNHPYNAEKFETFEEFSKRAGITVI